MFWKVTCSEYNLQTFSFALMMTGAFSRNIISELQLVADSLPLASFTGPGPTSHCLQYGYHTASNGKLGEGLGTRLAFLLI